MPLYRRKKAAEYDPTGKEVWSVQLEHAPYSATRLANGNTLVAFLQNANKSNPQIVEFDRNQRLVWSHRVEGTVFLASRR